MTVIKNEEKSSYVGTDISKPSQEDFFMLGECLHEKQVYRMDRSFFIICEIARAGILKSCGNAKKIKTTQKTFLRQ